MKAVVIGCGRMGSRHIKALSELGIQVEGLFDVIFENTKQTALQNNLPENSVYQDIDSLFSNIQPNLCIIATTTPSHEEYIIKAALSGVKKILCEKPLSNSVKSCMDIINLCQSHEIDLAVNHQMRFMDQYCIPKKMLYSDDFGGLESITVTAGNFGLAMNGSHYFEMMRFMFDESPCKVSAWFDAHDVPNPRGANFRDKSGSIRLYTSSGKRFYMDASASNGHGLIVVYTAKYGQIIVDELVGNIYYTHRKAEERDLPSTRYGQPYIINSISIKSVDVIDSTKKVIESLIAGKNYPSAKEASHAIKSLVAAYVSNEKNHIEIDINDSTLPLERKFAWA